MRVPFLLYGVLYVLVEVVGAQLAVIGWPQLTALDVATAVANACLTVAVGVAVLVGADVGGRRWRRSVGAWRQERALAAAVAWEDAATITVSSWRPEPLALPAGPSSRAAAPGGRPRDAAPGGDYATPSRGRPFPEEPGRLF
ncbi:hypothetical protein [Geodermatophilus sp. DSM 44513]|uniref:hypothetical protein n=1 Tax=Geodermatophilus sp. DSM 44513 TaxID=1528104 RepID=UPI00127E552E|nr:hypothetical protein [Geodermatophilus sp. DSM 44513]WNV73968.1 hypothetical protein RTG05_13325 [Geodermatophilus sp. DSM 44513]